MSNLLLFIFEKYPHSLLYVRDCLSYLCKENIQSDKYMKKKSICTFILSAMLALTGMPAMAVGSSLIRWSM